MLLHLYINAAPHVVLERATLVFALCVSDVTSGKFFSSSSDMLVDVSSFQIC